MQIRKSRENGLILAISLGNQSKKVLLGKLALMEGMYAWWKSSTPLINNSPERLVWINQCVFSHFGAEERPIINMDGWVLSKQALFLPIPSWIKQRSTKAEWGSKLLLSTVHWHHHYWGWRILCDVPSFLSEISLLIFSGVLDTHLRLLPSYPVRPLLDT